MKTKLYMLAEQGHGQMMSYVLQTGQGRLAVIDGGRARDAANLEETLVRLGGPEPVVEMWLLTHPHSDHVEALVELFSRPTPVQVKRIYRSFHPIAFYAPKVEDEEWKKERKFLERYAEFEDAHRDICCDFVQGQKLVLDEAVFHVLYVQKQYLTDENTINNDSVVFRLDAGEERVLFTGDLGREVTDHVLEQIPAEKLKADYVQMAHHGQNGVTKKFYERVAPSACLWNTPDWLWDNDRGEGFNTGPWKTVEVRGWMEELGVKRHFVTKGREREITLG